MHIVYVEYMPRVLHFSDVFIHNIVREIIALNTAAVVHIYTCILSVEGKLYT